MSEEDVDILRLIYEDPDYVSISHVKYSLDLLLKKYPEGCPDHVICSALGIHHSELPALLKKALKKIEQEF